MKQFLIGFFVASAVWLAWHGNAQETYVVVSGLAYHLDGEKHCNSRTTGLGLERVNGADRYSFGAYRNSQCKWSAFAARAWMPIRLGNLSLGGISGIVSGYGRPITPVAGFAATYERDGWGVNLLYVPEFRGSGNVLWWTAKFAWR